MFGQRLGQAVNTQKAGAEMVIVFLTDVFNQVGSDLVDVRFSNQPQPKGD